MRLVLALMATFILGATCSAEAQMLTFEEPQSNQAMTNVYNGTRTMYYSPSHAEWVFGDVSLTAVGSKLYLRSTFDDRSPNPYPYRFITRNVAQIQGAQLRIDFPNGTNRFGFGAALNATSGQGQMLIEVSGADGALLGTYNTSLQRSTNNNGNTNSEGVFFVSDVGDIRSVMITNLGDPLVPSSLNGWVIDNIQYAAAAQVGPQGPAGPVGPVGPQGPKGDPGDATPLPSGTVIYVTRGSVAPNGYIFSARFGLFDVYVKQ